jgi:hypothetical protein
MFRLERPIKGTHGGRATPMRQCLSLDSSALHPPSTGLPYGIGGSGKGATPQIDGSQGGRGGVGIRN